METTATETHLRSIDLFEKSNGSKQDRYITGSDFDKRTGKSYCFRGIALYNNVINITVATEIAPQTAQQTSVEIGTGKPN